MNYHFRKSKSFIYTGLDPQEEIEILISACAVQITFGLRRYKMPFFKEIQVLADQYQLGINQQEWIGHVNRTRGLTSRFEDQRQSLNF